MWIRLSTLLPLFGILVSAPTLAGGQFHVLESKRKSVKVVAVLPMRLEPAFLDSSEGAEKVVGRIEAGVQQRLRDAGYTVVEPARFRDFWEVEQPKAGALYHPFSGQRNEAAYTTLRTKVLRRLAETYPHDATVEMSLVTQVADMKEGAIEWDDAVESAAGYNLLGDLLLGPGRNNEMLQVLSLQVVFNDRNGERMFTGQGGLQPMQRSPFFGSMYDLKPVPLYDDPKRENRAMDMALGAWLLTPKVFKAAQRKARTRFSVPRTDKPPPKATPFDRNAFFASKPTIAVTPVALPAFNGDGRAVRAQYNSLVVTMLKNMGYQVVPAGEFAKAWEYAISNSFGLYDEFTGRAIPGARDEMMKQVMTELREKHGVDALLSSVVTRRMVSFSGGHATWDGRRYVSVPGSDSGNDNRLREHFGVVPALSLNIALLDAQGQRLVGGVGGIQMTQRFTQSQFVDIDERDWFQDGRSNAEAVWLALSPLDESEKEKKAATKAAASKDEG